MNTQLAIQEPEYIDIWAEPDPVAADTVKSDIETLLDSIKNQELKLATSHARLGRQLLRVQQDKFWIPWGYASWGSYIDSISQRIDRGRASIYAYVSVAEKLLPSISEEDLDRMGISRAQELARYVKQSGMSVPEHLLLDALNPKVKLDKLHANVLEALHEKGEIRGSWWDPLGGSYYTDDEKLEVQEAMELAVRVGEIDPSLPDHQKRKEIILSFAREFVSSNSHEVV